MTSDANKGITSITYNYLNLPTLVNFGSDDIEYIYDAMGTKLKKIVTQNSIETRTVYAGNYIYENGTLQFFSHPEGYVTPDGSGGYDYIYQYKDHLGNVRLSYADRSLDDQFYFETGTEGWSPNGTATVNNNNQKLNISITNRWNSASQYYDVTPGVPIHIEFNFEQGDMANPYFFVRERINGVWESNANRDLIASMTDGHHVLDMTPTGDYIRVYFEKATASDDGTLTTCYVDNFKIYQKEIEIVEESNYYPFGLEHKGYNNVVNGTENNYQTYNGKELEKSLGLEWLDFGARNYDPALGRWMNLDPLAEQMRRHSPYNYAFNNPIFFIDPDGMAPQTVKPEDEKALAAIKNTLSEEDRKAVRLDADGNIDKDFINNHSSESGNFSDLKELVNSETVVEVSVSDSYQIKDENGEIQTEEIRPVERYDDMEPSPMSVQTGEFGLYGITTVPDGNSPDENVHVTLNSSLSEEGQAQIYSHEGNGHALQYVRGEDHKHRVKNDNGVFRETNTKLKTNIIRSIQETIKNMKNN